MKKYLLGLYKRDTGLYLDVTNHDKITYEARLRLLENIMIEVFHFEVYQKERGIIIYKDIHGKKKVFSWEGFKLQAVRFQGISLIPRLVITYY